MKVIIAIVARSAFAGVIAAGLMSLYSNALDTPLASGLGVASALLMLWTYDDLGDWLR